MLNIYICEDNDNERDYLSQLIKNIILIEDYDLNFACATADPYELLNIISTDNNTGLYFLDIDLGKDIDGLLLAQKIRQYDQRGFIVFVTTHSEMSRLTFQYKVEAMDYIIKDEPKKINDHIHQCIIVAYQRYCSPSNNYQNIYRLTSGEKEFWINFDEIYYFETSENIHKVILHAQNQILEFQAKLKEIEPELDKRFCRCHRSFIINTDKISDINLKERTITLTNNDIVLASKTGIKKLLPSC